MGSKHSANDQRSIAKNPNNSAYVADRANRAALGHENVPPAPPPPVSDASGETNTKAPTE